MVDICLLVEGAYPYVTGGVSSWLHALISNLPDFTFAIVYIGPSPDPKRKKLYPLPKNVTVYQELFLNDPASLRKQKSLHRIQDEAWKDFQRFHEALALSQHHPIKSFTKAFQEPGFAGLTVHDLLHARESWELLTTIYQQFAPKESFVDFFWTFRLTYRPIFSILEATLPEASVYHAISTGFSGMLGALSKLRTGRPFLITEHGLYTREREIEISQSTWFNSISVYSSKAQQPRLGFFQEWWFNIYRFMESLSYETADAIISITQVNQRYQHRRGANPRKMLLIPNGINIDRFLQLRQSIMPSRPAISQAEKGQLTLPSRQVPHQSNMIDLFRQKSDEHRQSDPFIVGFVGRIVPIKDVKTFIRAIHLASQTIPQLEVYLVGPTEEDQGYYEECRQLANLLNIEHITQFTGTADVGVYYRKVDVIVLTSLSEGQPLVIMEGNCAGVPVIATDVGACRELLFGVTPEDQALGASGILTAVASPNETAMAMVKLWQNRSLAQQMGLAGQKRIKHFYRQEQLYSNYTSLYRECIDKKGEIAWQESDFASRLLFAKDRI